MSRSIVDQQPSVPAQRFATEAETNELSAPVGWVPVERRWLGFDKATIAPSAIVLGLALLMGLLIPRINDAIDYDDPVRDGDVIALSQGVTFTPPVGWAITEGVRVAAEGDVARSTASATIIKGDLQVTITSGPFDGDSEALLVQIKETAKALDAGGPTASGATAQITTASGLDGVASQYRDVNTEGLIAAFAADGQGIEFVATGPPGSAGDDVEELAQILASIERKES